MIVDTYPGLRERRRDRRALRLLYRRFAAHGTGGFADLHREQGFPAVLF